MKCKTPCFLALGDVFSDLFSIIFHLFSVANRPILGLIRQNVDSRAWGRGLKMSTPEATPTPLSRDTPPRTQKNPLKKIGVKKLRLPPLRPKFSLKKFSQKKFQFNHSPISRPKFPPKKMR